MTLYTLKHMLSCLGLKLFPRQINALSKFIGVREQDIVTYSPIKSTPLNIISATKENVHCYLLHSDGKIDKIPQKGEKLFYGLLFCGNEDVILAYFEV